MKIRFLIIGMLVLISTISYSQQSDRNDKRMERLKAQKIAFITSNLNLSVEESEKFWPVYNALQEELSELRSEMKAIRPSRDAEMTNKEAETFLNKSMDLEEKELSIRKAYISKLNNAIPMNKVAKLNMVEREFKHNMLEKIKERYKGSKSRKDGKP